MVKVGAAVTVSDVVVVCTSEPLVPVPLTVMVNEPIDALPGRVKLRVLGTPGVTELGLKPYVVPVGHPEQSNKTEPLNPLRLPIVTV